MQVERRSDWLSLRSSVLGGAVLVELKRVGATNNWNKDVYVYVGSERIAVQMDYITFPLNSEVRWLYQNPVTGSLRGTIVWSELDPFGLDVGRFNEPSQPPPDYSGSGILFPVNGDPTNLSGGCTLDGAPISCDTANGLLSGGAAYEAVAASAFYTVRNRTTGGIIQSGAFLLNTGAGIGMLDASAFGGLGIINGNFSLTPQEAARASAGGWASYFSSLFNPSRNEAQAVESRAASYLISSGGDLVNGFFVNVGIASTLNIVGFNSSQFNQINNQVAFMYYSKACASAFKAAGLTPVNEMIDNGGLSFVHNNLLGKMANNSKWQGTESTRIGIRNGFEAHAYTADVTLVGPDASSDRYYVGLNENSFNNSVDTPPRVIVHALMHAGGARGESGPLPGGKHARKREHDLSQMNPAKYEQMMKNCIE